MEENAQNKELLPKKYKIQECIENLKRSEYKIILKAIPGIIGKGLTTFYNYRDICIDDKEDIPFKIARKLEILFGLESGGLETKRTKGKHYLEIVEEHRKRQ
ncbi:hypothetical protein D3C87_215160 [compost metagenome]|uniref:hypothetical protein n=1 Tax=Pedobacter sp. ok626 TaxID=1761882 RepID=UPI00088972F4|nr:hypothetical protein [Pedobacter sp. ok626]SDL04564.1 hypothetical protein SAMN04487898_114105 [Pedobacter sp. ok626]